MRSPILLLLFCLLAAAFFPLHGAPAAPEVKVAWNGSYSRDDGPEGVIRTEKQVPVSFPSAMAPNADIGGEGKPAPIRFDPELPGKWVWKSQTDGVFTVGDKVIPDQKYRVLVVKGLKDIQGKSVSDKQIGRGLSDPFTVDSDTFDSGKQPLRPEGRLRFSYLVWPASVAECAYFQDRDNRRRYPVDVIVVNQNCYYDSEEDGTPGVPQDQPVKRVKLVARDDLPKGRTYDLVVDGVVEANTGYRMKQPYVAPLGLTEPLKIKTVGTRNSALEGKFIHIDFNDEVDVKEGSKIRIEPVIEGLKWTVGDHRLMVSGTFDIRAHYKVIVPASVKGLRGYPLAVESRWGATFQPKLPEIVFPNRDSQERSQLGFRLPFDQVNMGPLHWRLATVPPEKLPALQKRLREFTQPRLNPVTDVEVRDQETGVPLWQPTELLIEASHLDALAQGDFEASQNDELTRREIVWKPEGSLPAGPCILEVTGTTATGKVIGNRTLISFTETDVLQKQADKLFLLRATRFGDGSPLDGIKVKAVSGDNHWRAEGVTDKQGEVRFAHDDLFPWEQSPAEWFLLDTPDGLMFQPVRGNQFSAEGSWTSRSKEKLRIALLTDRPLYRPGQTVKFKGFVRELTGEDGALGIPEGEPVAWSIVRSRTDDDEESHEAIASGTTVVDPYGGFEGEWAMPKTIGTRHYTLNAKLPRKKGETGVEINVQEFRPPPFTVKLTESNPDAVTAGVRIQSIYFHGAPNSGAMVKWDAVWTRLRSEKVSNPWGSYFVETDPAHVFRIQEDEKKVSGEGKLGPDGTLVLHSKPPFTDAVPRGWYQEQWTVSVMGSEGQTITEPALFPLHTVPVALGIEASEKPGKGKIVVIKATAYQPNDEPATGTPLRADLYHVINKSVKEQIAPHVYRYRNTTLYEKVKTVTGTAPLEESVTVAEPGDYLAVIHHAETDAVPTEYYQFGVSGNREDRPAEFAQTNDEKFEVKADKKSYTPGETAALSLQAPFAGNAWVSIEADGRVLDAFECRLESNAGRVEIPIKKTYFPNAWVSIYLMRPGGEDRLPAERMGSVELNVSRPDLDLHINPALSGTQARPGELVSGTVEALCEGKPVADTDLTIYAVDEALLVAGGWQEPKFLEMIYPRRNWAVQSYFSKLNELGRSFNDDALSQKGFILGDGSEGGSLGPKKAARKAFLPLAFWKTGVRTGPDGKASFEFKAPDSLTRYRVIALAQTKAHQFGFGSSSVEISKPVQIEPALPRFLRIGDAVELRAIVRQTVADALPVALHCEGSLQLQGAATLTQSVPRNDPSVFRFPVTVGDTDSATVRWDTEAGPGDAVEMTLPVYPPTLLRKEAVFGALGNSDPLGDLHRLVPDAWNQAVGKADVTLSTSPWLPKLTGLPLLLQYPHGCFEQITSRILGYTALGSLLAYLPDGGLHDHEYRLRVEEGLEKMNAALLEGGWLPYWPGGKPSAYPTIAGYWAARSAKANGWDVPPRLLSALPKTVRSIAEGKEDDRSIDPFMRCFALMVLSEEKAEKLEPVAQDLYQRREHDNEESRAFLAIAMHRLGIMPKEKEQLLKEIDRPLKPAGFNPDTFGSTTRTEAIRAWAFAVIHPEARDGKARKELGKRIDELLDSARALSTQENFWLLLAFQAMHAAEPAPAVDFSAISPAPTALSANKASALWANCDIRSLRQLSLAGPSGKPAPLAGTVGLLEAQFRMESADAEKDNRTDRGFRVERVVRNLTDPARTGEAAAPWKLGDQILITIRLLSPKEQHYVAVEGELPACLETLNPNLPSVARSYSVPMAQDDKPLVLSFAELRDKTTLLYFNQVEPGMGVYSVLARVTSAGTFHWPATQAVPMYDSRFSGVSAAGEVHSIGE